MKSGSQFSFNQLIYFDLIWEQCTNPHILWHTSGCFLVTKIPKKNLNKTLEFLLVKSPRLTWNIRWTSTKLVLGYLVVTLSIFYILCTPSNFKTQTHHDFTKFDHEPVGVIAEKVRMPCSMYSMYHRIEYGILKGCHRCGSPGVPICSYGFLWFLLLTPQLFPNLHPFLGHSLESP